MSGVDADTSLLTPEVARVLHDAFGATPIDELSVHEGGRSGATLLSVTVAGHSYILRKPNAARPYDHRVAQELTCIETASQQGVAPLLRYVDRDTCITISEKIAGAALGRTSSWENGRTARLVTTLRKLHQGPAFPRGMSILGVVRDFDDGLRARDGTGLPSQLLDMLADVSHATARFAESAPCHNDLNPGNIIETQDRIYFVDWETACAGDPFFDLAEIGVFAFPTPDHRRELLEAYLERMPTEEERARAILMRVMALAFYTVAFLHVAVATGGSPDLSTTPPVTLPQAFMNLRQGLGGPTLVAASFYAEMLREGECDAYEAAKRTLVVSDE
jgi:aminoglycoside phosphotransferase (APT) family kinase protein